MKTNAQTKTSTQMFPGTVFVIAKKVDTTQISFS